MLRPLDKRGVLAAMAFGLSLGVFSVASAEARENYAVLVGVTNYPNLKGANLIGPNNDVQLVREYLETRSPVRFAPEHVTLLADGVEGASGSPVHDEIVGALAKVASEAERGDFVYLHLSGHGTQQPAVDVSTEPDGLDEVFLPADTNMWTDRAKGIPSAFTDDEIGAALDAIRAKGAFVWIVIDACHSGTATRAAPVGGDEITERKIEPEQLGIPQEALKEATDEAAKLGGGTRGIEDPEQTRALALYADKPQSAEPAAPGGLVAFFAAQTVETTPEMLLPRGVDNAEKYGLFTYTLFSEVAENPTMSYRQLGQAIMQAYSGENRTRPTPLFEGDLDAPVFGMDQKDYIEQWPIEVDQATGITVPAGMLQRLAPGTRLAILEKPGATLDEAIGYLEVKSADNLTSKVSPVAYDDKPALSPANIPDNAYARLAEVSFQMELRVARPAPHQGFETEIAEVNTILDSIANDDTTPVKLKLVAPEDSADLKLAVLSEEDAAILIADSGGSTATVATRAEVSPAPRLWFLPPTAEISLDPSRRPPSIGFAGSTPEGLQGEVAQNLTRIFRATNLARLSTASNYSPDEVSVGFTIDRQGDGTGEALDAAKVPQVHPGDRINLTARNDSTKPVDLNVLYVGSDYSITHMYAQRLHSGSNIDLPLLEFTDSSFGIERMVVVLTEGSAMSNVQDLRFLEQEGVRQLTRDVGHPEGFEGLLADIGNAPSTRGAARLGARDESRGGVLIYQLETEPRTGSGG